MASVHLWEVVVFLRQFQAPPLQPRRPPRAPTLPAQPRLPTVSVKAPAGMGQRSVHLDSPASSRTGICTTASVSLPVVEEEKPQYPRPLPRHLHRSRPSMASAVVKATMDQRNVRLVLRASSSRAMNVSKHVLIGIVRMLILPQITTSVSRKLS